MERPRDLTDHQEQVVRMVAQYIYRSVDASRFQARLMQQAAHNHNFAFLFEEHPHNPYFAYLLYALRVSGATRGQQEEHAQYFQQVAGPASGAGGGYYGSAGHDPSLGSAGEAGREDPYQQPSQHQHQQPSQQQQQQQHYGGGAPPSDYRLSVPVGASSHAQQHQHGGSAQAGHHAKRARSPVREPSSDDDDTRGKQKWRFVVENGVRRAVRDDS